MMKPASRSASVTSAKTTDRSLRSSRSSLSLMSISRSQKRSQFADYYADLCEIQHGHPITAVKQNLDKGILDFIADRIKFDEWWSIINALSCDKTLHFIAIRLRHAFKEAVDSADTELKARAMTKQPVVTTRFVLLWLVEAVKLCVSQSTTLTVLELEGLPLATDYLSAITRGIGHTTSLQHLSLSKCNIQDNGTEILCMAIKNIPSIVSLDLSHCGLTEKGAEILSNLIRYQKLNRYSEAWKQTLRYRDPDVEAMPGLRRITINSNPIGDTGLELLAEEVKDDLWLRALDVQDCSFTDNGGRVLLELVEANRNLVIVDGRGNPYMSEDILTAIMNSLSINNAEKPQSEYKWISKNPNLNKKSHQVVSKPKLRPWSCQSMRAYSQCSGDSSRQFRRSNTTLNQSSIALLRKCPDRITDYAHLDIQLRDFMVLHNQEVQEKHALIEENKKLKESLEKCELEKKKLLETHKNKVLIEADTLRALEETIGRFGMYLSQEQEEEEDSECLTTGRSVQEAEMPELVSSLKLLLQKATDSPSFNPSYKKYCTQDGFKLERNSKRGRRPHQNDMVIWEEDENVSNCGDPTPKSVIRPEGHKTKAQVMFAQLLENNQSSEDQTDRAYDSDVSEDSDSDSKSAEVAEKPLTSSGEDSIRSAYQT